MQGDFSQSRRGNGSHRPLVGALERRFLCSTFTIIDSFPQQDYEPDGRGPTDLTFADTPAGIVIGWNQPPNWADGEPLAFNVYRDTPGNIISYPPRVNAQPITGNTFTDSSGQAPSTYTYQVSVIRGGVESFSEEYNATWTVDETILPAPTNVRAAFSPEGINLQWDAFDPATKVGFEKYQGRWMFPDRYSESFESIPNQAKFSLVNTPDLGGPQHFEVSYRAGGRPSHVAELVVDLPRPLVFPDTPPAADVELTAPNVTTVSWQPVPNATAYVVERRKFDDPDGKWTLVAGDVSGTSLVDSALPYDTGLAYRVIARDGVLRSAPGESKFVQTMERRSTLIRDQFIEEPVGDSMTVTMTVTLSRPSDTTIVLNYATKDGSAEPSDYIATSGRLIFAPGELSKDVEVVVLPDDEFEPTEYIFLDIEVVEGDLDGRSGRISVRPPRPSQISVADVTITEPLSGAAQARFDVVLDRPANEDIRLLYGLSMVDKPLVIPKGATSAAIEVPVLADQQWPEPDEQLTLKLSVDEGNGQLIRQSATLTIIDATPQTVLLDRRQPVRLTGADEKQATVTISGPGTGSVQVLGNGLVHLQLSGTAGSSVRISGAVVLGDVNIAGSLKTLSGKKTDLAGKLVVTSGVSTLGLRDVRDGSQIMLGASGDTVISLGEVQNATLDSAARIRSLRVESWWDNSLALTDIRSPGIGAVSAASSFAADIVTGDLGSLTVKQGLFTANIISTGNIGTVKAKEMNGSILFAGIDPALTALPDSADDFVTAASIRSVILGKARGAFFNSRIAASMIGSVDLSTLSGMQPGENGISARQVRSAKAIIGDQRWSMRLATGPQQSFAHGDFVVRLV